MLPGWNLATKTNIACDVGVRKALHLDFETCKMYMYYGVYNHPIGNCLHVYVVMRTLYVISCTTQWGLYLGKCLTFLERDSPKWLTLKCQHVLICFPSLCLFIMLIKFYAKGTQVADFEVSACFDLFSLSLPIHNANKILCKRKFHRIIL
jgi:hypothetical protein